MLSMISMKDDSPDSTGRLRILLKHERSQEGVSSWFESEKYATHRLSDV